MNALSISAGGIVSVDTGTLRAVAARLRWVAAETDECCRAARAAAGAAGPVDPDPAAELLRAGATLAAAAERAGDLAGALEQTADLYDLVEVLAEKQAAAAAGDTAAVTRLGRQAEAMIDANPWLLEPAVELLGGRRSIPGDLASQSLGAALALGPLLPLLLLLPAGRAAGWSLGRVGAGTVQAAERMHGAVEPVRVRPVSADAATAPATLAAAAARIPGGAASRVRVERYTMPDGSAQFAVYVAGTQSLGGTDPFDMRSNVELYTGERAASYEAVVAALEAAGARPGDVVHAFGHSQGAMVAERLAIEGPFQTRTLVSFGSPVQAEAGPGTLAVSVRHTDDPVAALQAGGFAGPIGAPGSFVAERSADPFPGVRDLLLPAHQMTAYAQTAAMLDASADPRVDGLRAVFDELGTAAAGRGVDYAAERVPSGSG